MLVGCFVLLHTHVSHGVGVLRGVVPHLVGTAPLGGLGRDTPEVGVVCGDGLFHLLVLRLLYWIHFFVELGVGGLWGGSQWGGSQWGGALGAYWGNLR